MILSVLSSPSVWTELVVSLVAASGGVIVYWALRLEEYGEKEEYRDIEDFRSSKLKSSSGRKILMRGIVVEIVVAFAVAAWDGLEIRQIARQMAKNDPRNQPVSDLSVDLQFTVHGTNTIKYEGIVWVARLLFGRFPALDSSVNFPGFVASDYTFQDYNREGTRTYYLRFRPDPGLGVGSGHLVNLGFGYPVSDIAKLDVLSLHLDFLPRHFKILDGMAVLNVSPGGRKEFPIPPLTMFFSSAYIHLVNGTNAVPIVFTMGGTNWIPQKVPN